MKKMGLLIILLFMISNLTFASKSISYTDEGQGTPLLLIHAFPTDQNLWSEQRQELKNYFRIITLDLMGFGQSQAVDGKAISMSDFAEQVKILLDQLHIKKAVIGGESMGGYVTLSFLKKYPEKVQGLILSDTQCIADTEEAKAKRELAANEILEHGTSQFINNFMPKALSSFATDQTKLFLKNMLEKQSAQAMASALRGMALREDTCDILANTNLPTLILTGDLDSLISPKQSQTMHELVKNNRLVVLRDAGHLSNLEQPKQWNKAVVEMFGA